MVVPVKMVFKRFPQDDDELWLFVQAVWGYRIPRNRVCKEHVPPFRAFADAYFARHPVTVWKASRGFGGKTATLGTLSLTEAVCLSAQITVLGGSAAQSLRVHEVGQEAWAFPNAPKQLLSREPTRYDTRLTNGAWIRALTASQTSVRGPHPQRLRLDEIDEMDLSLLEAAQGQPMAARGIQTQTVMSSTHQYPDKTMTEILKRAREKNWPVYEWCYRETSNPTDGWLPADAVARKRTEVTTAMWDIEYDLQEPSFEGRAIDHDRVEECFDAALGIFEGNVGEKIVIMPPPDNPQRTGPYITAVDWAKERDWTIVATFLTESTPWICVAWQRLGRLPWPEMVARAETQWTTYGGRFTHDATGIGNVVSDYLANDIGKGGDVILGGRGRQDIFSEYISAIENGDIRYPRIRFAYEEHKYATLDDLFGRGHPPDSFVAGSLGWHRRARYLRPVLALPVSITKTSHWSI